MKWISILKNCFRMRVWKTEMLCYFHFSLFVFPLFKRGACAQIRKQMADRERGVRPIFTARKVYTLVAVLAHYVRVHVSRSGKLTAQSRSRCTGTALAIRYRSQISSPRFTPKVPGGRSSSTVDRWINICKSFIAKSLLCGNWPSVSHCRVRNLIIGCMSTPFQYLHYAPGSRRRVIIKRA